MAGSVVSGVINVDSLLTNRGGQTAVAYSPTGKRLIKKRCKAPYTHAVLTRHVNTRDYGWFSWCESLEEAIACREEAVPNSEASWGFVDVVIVECRMVNPWEL